MNIHSVPRRALMFTICLIVSFATTTFAQTIGGNVYGGGNQGDVDGSSTVELHGGTIEGNVFGGACAADVGERTFVDVNATNTLIVKGIYGGNDESGEIGHVAESNEMPFNPIIKNIDKSWNSFIRVAQNSVPVIIGTLYGGGNGAYSYDDESQKPVLGKTYIELNGGIYGQVYAGGNNATVTENTVLYMNNRARLSVPTGDFLSWFDNTDYKEENGEITFKHHVSRMFGGNNLAEMSIRPTWNLIAGSINNLYSGGNKGAMTAEDGISLTLANAGLTVNNVYGGCRMADVNPSKMTSSSDGYAAHVRIDAGTINNVYGGNDISGKVNYGTKVEIFSSIKGDVYGGGNGSYAYTDNSAWVTAHPEDADYYYDPSTSSIDALFNFRPHIEKTLIHVAGSETKSITLGSVYCGGNSATLYQAEGDAAATFKIGKNVTIGNVFLGSNGANMLSSDMALKYAREENSVKFSSISFANNVVARYMDGVAVNIVPTIVWDNKLDYSTRIGSFFCGGNVGSMTYDGVAKTENNNLLIFPAGITITDKIVAGCNKASIIQDGNVIYEGGLIGDADTNGDKVRIKVLSCLEPSLSANAVKYQDAEGTINESKIYQGANVYGGCYQSGVVNGNVVIDVESDIMAPNLDTNILKATGDYIDASALAIYGGGYGENAVIKGNTTINLTGNARILKVFGGGEMGSVTGNTTVKLGANLKYANNVNAYKVYAGGYAGDVKGNTTLNLLGGSVMTAFAGACNANIGGATEVIIGTSNNPAGVPYIAEAVYGGNDFGGTIEGSKLYDNITVPDGTKNVRTQTYVQYLSGKIGRALYGGSYGSYDYNNTTLYPTSSYTKPTILTSITKQDGDDEETICTNTFVNITSQSTSSDDIIGSDNSESVLTMIAGGGRGYKGLPDYVEVGRTYLLLHGATYANRNNQLMAHRVYGGGNLSKVGDTRIDAYSGSFGQIFGGTHGVYTTETTDLEASYDCANTTINYYGTMGSANMNLFGTGANSGATGTATINLYAGDVGNVYGGSLAEGYTAVTRINVPNSSNKVIANAIFGGALGEDEGRPCDVGVSNITFASATAKVKDGIYGGNHAYRATKETNITISTPVRNQYENLLSIYGAGYGAGTVAGSTHITLEADAEVVNVYGGGREGKVYYAYSNYSNGEAFSQYANNGKHASWQIKDYDLNTSIKIHGGPRPASDGELPFVDKAHVTGNVYGAGYGSVANSCGKTKVQLLGGTVDGDIYGGGFEGSMLSLDNSKDYDVNISSLCVIEGGQVRNVFGGGYQGNIEGNSGVDIGTKTGTTFYAGVPTILRSAYGGGEMAKVSGTSTVNMYNGYIGYRYHADAAENNKYLPELKLNADDEANLLKENGNLYGAGFGEGAVVMNTQVNLYDGTVRNGVYGGGEIAAVGDGTYNSTTQKYTITKGGQTNVKMYGGLVVGDVFGGGRGFSYDLTGNQVIGKTLYSDGYVFGKTKVEIYRGTIGTDASLAEGHGNVFGGGNIGYVYSAGQKYTGTTEGTMINGHYYHKSDDPSTDIVETTAHRTEDCCVRISVNCLVTADAGVTISNNKHFAKGEYVPTEYFNTLAADDPIRSSLGNDGVVTADAGVTISNNKHFAKGEYVPTEYLNTLAAGDTRWNSLDDDGVTIRNAVFAGGNVSAGSDLVYANAVTVYGNATASVIDAFSRDLVILGGEHIGGLYGDGNLTFVDGYRELNITNYGTDYHHLSKQINKSAYDALDYREQAYYTYDENEETENKWKIYDTSGRTMNTIQRADFCGVFGCRILLHGAQDRVPDVVDYTNYTINRVGEVSLNCVTQDNNNPSIATQSSETPTANTHGNYFGIYNIVNFLGSLTSDVEFTGDYYTHKVENIKNTNRNARTSVNTVALASGVFLELVESLDNEGQKVYGPITGVVGLDLINVKPGEGGGFVYAKNEHGKAKEITDPNKKIHFTLSDANSGAITHAAYEYDEKNKQVLQTSGNFVLEDSERSVIDDCFPNAGDINSPAHYWYINGNYYVYEQNISAYTGAARTYDKNLNIPLTITKGSNGKVRITSIKPNLYFVGDVGVSSFRYGNTVYTLNDPISYWDWTQLTSEEHRKYFKYETYVSQTDGSVIDKGKYDRLSDDEKQYYRISNEMSHDNGYLLTFDMTNPLEWDTYYTNSTNNHDKLLGSALKDLDPSVQDTYLQAPTIKCNVGGIYGQRSYAMGDNVGQAIIDGHADLESEHREDLVAESLAEFEEVYIAKEDVIIDQVTYVEGSCIGYATYDGLNAQQKLAFDRAYLCINTIEVAEKDYVLNGNLISQARYNELIEIAKTDDEYLAGIDITQYFSLAWTCKKAGKYGGTYFNANQNYNAIDICALPNAERTKKVKIEGKDVQVFTFNYDALDLFVANFDDDIRKYGSPYDQEVVYVDFTATFTGANQTYLKKKTLDEDGVYNGDVEDFNVTPNKELSRREYELILNEQAHYVPVTLSSGTNYIVEQQFEIGDDVYVSGQTMTQDAFNNLNETQKENITTFNNETSVTNAYFCKSDYKRSSISPSITAINGEEGKYKIGSIISIEDFNKLPNYQKEFNVVGDASIETATLYVPRESDIQNLSKDRIITVELEYKYNDNNREKTEKHVINIRVQFKSGQPSIGEVIAPAVVLPNTTVGLTVPSIIPGAYEIIGGGWEIFKNKADADSRKNGEPYINNATPMYWYQNGYYVAYYAKTYLGKAYSNPVPFTVANYHRLGEVMNHPEYMYIDHKEVKRNPKIYLDAAEYGNASIAANSTKNDLDYLADLLSVTYQVNTEEVKNPETDKTTTITTNEVDERIKGCANLDFILRSDISPKANANWSSIASGNDQCFAGTLHGNGYTISGLNNSLFGNLCGKVYNLGVTGSFIGGGIADYGTCPLSQHTSTNGYAENCWVYTTGTPNPTTTKAIIGAGGTIVNSYYHANNAFAEGEGIATKKDASAFLRGEVTYNLNGFHLYKRSNSQQKNYVENYFADGDFIYANGTIPLTSDERLKNGQYIPLADDYIFFGQRLIYGDGHESLPNRINKNGNSIDRTAANSDRVYSAPAYFMNDEVGQVYFNTESKFVDSYNTFDIHKNLTAIDFTGYGDGASKLDIEKLTGFALGEGLTKNLLVYAPEDEDSNSPYKVAGGYLNATEPSLTISSDGYQTVAQNNNEVRGHLVTKNANDVYIAEKDHFLVDRENFNVPIAYTFKDNYHMWYQRTPDRFAEGDNAGWDVVCLPFTAKLVTTHQKGEITHFYGDSKTMHEYWLRELSEVKTTTDGDAPTTTAAFTRPANGTNGNYTATSKFLYDTYYDMNDGNGDSYSYQKNYYEAARIYDDYGYLQANTPYIISFPGKHYREFDMSGEFVPDNTASLISKLNKQVVTMVSVDNAEIGKTDGGTATANGYSFVGTFQAENINDGYFINDEEEETRPIGSFFKQETKSSIPFRGYLVKTTSKQSAAPKRIFIGGEVEKVEEPQGDVAKRGLTVYGIRNAICIESTLEQEAIVNIFGAAGQMIAQVKVQPMSKEVVKVPSRGVYVVNNRKIMVQ